MSRRHESEAGSSGAEVTKPVQDILNSGRAQLYFETNAEERGASIEDRSLLELHGRSGTENVYKKMTDFSPLGQKLPIPNKVGPQKSSAI